ncbi:MAG: MTH1187 family thiamine-binding protein [Candidatus Marinimicrobia bacterium]|jgi:uncharacterized protein (TIGR00106 family)|nr:MTH1187 family thiamine-binding protein [Candidatus Neomarinimicrobiota bacterium]MBT3633268.1 MTH1187 family thiamine-binding protein [Candidatus Neomarinimicrobiota bacterium]MBT3682131.1 MTH1187 family thiamine-binding protein [Candidatus Neomarinimicrobiota bacterium]MBT3758868.1 MTH1187 family thiamine-binding protein [Candidatus Neomarinimicrobiota bacterium]MBT3895257.1 MTH1187 family thiamine-binding protein [Candidatus Neomarinimicrobiota bacterium]
MILAEFSIYPTDKGESVSDYVAQILKIIDESRIPYQLTPMGTILEGSWSDVMKVIGDCFSHLKIHSNRIAVNIKLDYRLGSNSRMTSKIEKIESILNTKLSH